VKNIKIERVVQDSELIDLFIYLCIAYHRYDNTLWNSV